MRWGSWRASKVRTRALQRLGFKPRKINATHKTCVRPTRSDTVSLDQELKTSLKQPVAILQFC